MKENVSKYTERLAREKMSDLDQFPLIIISNLNISCMNLAVETEAS